MFFVVLLSVTLCIVSSFAILVWRCFFIDWYRKLGLDPTLPRPAGSLSGWLGVVPTIDRVNAYRSFTLWSLANYPVVTAVLFGDPIVLVSDPEIARNVLSGQLTREKSHMYSVLKCFLGDQGLVSAEDSLWKPQRKLLSSVFHAQNIDSFINIFVDSGQEFVSILLEKASPLEPVDMDLMATHFALDVISRAMFTRSFNIQRDSSSPFPEAMRLGAEEMEMRIKNPLHKYNPFVQWRFRRATRFLRSICFSVIKEKRAKLSNVSSSEDVSPSSSSSDRPVRDLFDLMILARDPEKDTGFRLSDEDIYSQFVTFFFAGHDTTSHTIAWLCYLVASNPEVERKVVAELQEVLGDRNTPTLSDLGRMKYLQCVIKETLRLHPPVPQISRRAIRDFDLPLTDSRPGSASAEPVRTARILKDHTVTIVISSIHLNPAFWPNPYQFDPERFLPERSVGRHPAAWMPFSVGEKSCIGQQFALLEIKCMAAMLFKRLSFEPDRFRPPVPQARTTQAMDAVWLYVKPRVAEQEPILQAASIQNDSA